MLDKQLIKIKKQFQEELKKVKSSPDLFSLEKKFLGRKGQLTALFKLLKEIAEEERPRWGALLQQARAEMEDLLKEARQKVGAWLKEPYEESLDITLPGEQVRKGGLHPLTQLRWQVEDVFQLLGFDIADGPIVESEWYNFAALNIPAWHPAREMQDTFYLHLPVYLKEAKESAFEAGGRFLLRTHTSPVQIRAMEEWGVPLRIIVPGSVYRNEATDARHEVSFWQVEGLLIDKGVSLAHLKAVIKTALGEIFQKEVKLRWRPGYFPFVEPGLELDIECLLCQGKGCGVCKQTGWLEFMGAGLVHPRVLAAGGVAAEQYTGFAFGFGLTRLAMLKWRIDDVRLFLSGDLRFLEQFG